MQLEIRAYRGADHDAVVALWGHGFPDAPRRNDPVRDIQRKLNHEPGLFLVACDAGERVGVAIAGDDDPPGWGIGSKRGSAWARSSCPPPKGDPAPWLASSPAPHPIGP